MAARFIFGVASIDYSPVLLPMPFGSHLAMDFDYAGPSHGSRSNVSAGMASPPTEKVRRPIVGFSQLNTQPTDASVYASPTASRRPM